MSDKDALPPISVSMRDNNVVEHIGHQITFVEPAPSANAIWQGEVVVGEIGSPPQAVGNYLRFEKLFVDKKFDRRAAFKLQGKAFRLVSHEADSMVSIGGRPAQITLWGALCEPFTVGATT